MNIPPTTGRAELSIVPAAWGGEAGANEMTLSARGNRIRTFRNGRFPWRDHKFESASLQRRVERTSVREPDETRNGGSCSLRRCLKSSPGWRSKAGGLKGCVEQLHSASESRPLSTRIGSFAWRCLTGSATASFPHPPGARTALASFERAPPLPPGRRQPVGQRSGRSRRLFLRALRLRLGAQLHQLLQSRAGRAAVDRARPDKTQAAGLGDRPPTDRGRGAPDDLQLPAGDLPIAGGAMKKYGRCSRAK
jgi:hypothetical protein